MTTTAGRHRSRSRVPTVWVVAGVPGSGKSTLGRAIARATGAVVLDQDVATNPLMQQLAAIVGAGDDLDHPGLRGPVRAARYQCLVDIAVDNRRLGRSVVMIAPFTTEIADPVRFRAMAAKLAPARVVLVWVAIPPAVAHARRERRNLARDRAALQAAGSSTMRVSGPRPGGTADDPKVSSAPPAVPVLPVAPAPLMHHLVADGTLDPGAEAARIVAAARPAPGEQHR